MTTALHRHLRPLRRLLPALIVLVSTACQAQPVRQTPALMDLSSFPTSTLSITGARGTERFNLWIADTDARQEQGLMFVRDLPASQGMLFVNRVPRPMSMWMKNTYIPLDMLFIDARGRIIRIFANTTPHSLDNLGDRAPVRAVLELRGGETAARGIRVGDIVQHAAFRSGRVTIPRTPTPSEAR